MFHLYLPLVEDESQVLETPLYSRDLPARYERILLADDEKAAVDAIQPILEKLGYKITARTSSTEALELFRHSPGGFDLVIIKPIVMREMANKIREVLEAK